MIFHTRQIEAGNLYGIGVRTTNFTISQACLEIIAGATKGFRLLELRALHASGTAASYGLGRPAAKGVTPAAPVALSGLMQAGKSAQATTALSWATSPTSPSPFIARWNFPTTVGGGPLLAFDELWVPPNQTLVIFNITTAVALDVSIIIEEYVTP